MKKGFTLIELIASLVILAIIGLIVIPIVINIIDKIEYESYKRSIDNYGKSVELAIATHLLDTGTFPTDLKNLNVDYTGKVVNCNIMQMKENGGVYLSECKVNNVDIKDSKTEDGWYHYGTRDLTNVEYVDMYGLALKNASVAYYEANGAIVEDYRTLTIDYSGKPVVCDVTVNYNGTIYMTKCKVNNVDVTSVTEEDEYYHYGSIVKKTAVIDLIKKANDASVTSYSAGNNSEMYTFSHSATKQTDTLTDYRYIGATPNNYITFNNELWRIIGIFQTEDGNGNTDLRIKIINTSFERSMAYGTSNDWQNSNINNYLNNDYYNSLSDQSKLMIDDVKYYLGGTDRININGEEFYIAERSNNVYNSQNKYWVGKIGLMYPSDFSYTYSNGVDNGCYSKSYCDGYLDYAPRSWIIKSVSESNKWFITPYTSDNKEFYLEYWYRIQTGSTWAYVSNAQITANYYVLPTLYLDEDVIITSGDGSEQNPYQLSM